MPLRHAFSMSISGLAVVAVLAPAHAQQFYGGLVGEAGRVSVDAGALDQGNLTALSALGGVRFANGASPLSFGVEAETTLAANLAMNNFASDLIDRMSRLRLYAGREYGNYFLFGAVGASFVSGQLVGVPGNHSGFNIGFGVSRPVSDRVDLRVELIHDRINVAPYTWDNTAIRVGAQVRF